MRYWFWWIGLLLSSCRPSASRPPLGEDTTLQVLRELYAYRATVALQSLPPAEGDSLVQHFTGFVLAKYHIDSLRWDTTRRYYAQHPERWEALLNRLLTESP